MRKKTRNYLNRDFKKKREKDKLTKKRRSLLMSKIRSRNTKFEEYFIKALRKATKRGFKTHCAAIRGKPDIVFVKEKICVFLDSDFWHGWQFPRWKHLMKDAFWRAKIINNRRRDASTSRYLRKHGWRVLRIWEHHIKKGSELIIGRINVFLSLNR